MTNNKKIAKNTLMLYFRMLLVTIVSLYTARVTLNVLGIEDYGIFNVVGGLIGFLTIFNGAMVSASQRFLSFDLGRDDLSNYNKTFNTLLILFVIVGITATAIGLLIKNAVLHNVLNIPDNRLQAANWVYIFALLTFGINITAIPFMSSLIAHENMSIYGYVGILEAILKLVIVYFLLAIDTDKLLLYGFLNVIVSFIITMIYRIYCLKKYKECEFRIHFDFTLIKKIGSYIGWNMFGSVTGILNLQGQAVLLNIFYGPTVNGAKAIADRVYSIISSFSSNFLISVKPQIIKNYSKGLIEEMFLLVIESSKLAYFVVFIITVPLVLNIKNILLLWLGSIATNSEVLMFVKFILLYSLINVFEQPLSTAIQATGNIKKYQISVGIITLLYTPLLFLIFKLEIPAYMSILLLIFIYIMALFVRLYILRIQLKFPIRLYFNKCIIPIACVTIISLVLVYPITLIEMDNLFLELIVKCCNCVLISGAVIFFFGLNLTQKNWVKNYIIKLMNK